MMPTSFILSRKSFGIGAREQKAARAGGLRCISFFVLGFAFSSACDYLTPITPNVPARLLCGPAVKKSCFLRPLFALPPPNSIPPGWGTAVFLAFTVLLLAPNTPVTGYKTVAVPLFV